MAPSFVRHSMASTPWPGAAGHQASGRTIQRTFASNASRAWRPAASAHSRARPARARTTPSRALVIGLRSLQPGEPGIHRAPHSGEPEDRRLAGCRQRDAEEFLHVALPARRRRPDPQGHTGRQALHHVRTPDDDVPGILARRQRGLQDPGGPGSRQILQRVHAQVHVAREQGVVEFGGKEPGIADSAEGHREIAVAPCVHRHEFHREPRVPCCQCSGNEAALGDGEQRPAGAEFHPARHAAEPGVVVTGRPPSRRAATRPVEAALARSSCSVRW